ncbi:MAG: hypothetical protein EPO51_25830 [Phenylobacterium sp.]|uniref:hypothetical protein n=1 Tax=Phenylobacterium sp. TaxID=1871053 RepID=UPI0011FC1226|nr:hypothetical protein [Phenylobacterium sp.]TAJ68946.1 MAG: hypothetical protein EPO51_25830 [Phenylobacterium sp.]
MAVRPILPMLLTLGALALSGCASANYGYAYCYDPYRGPVGYYTGRFDSKPPCARSAGQAGVFATQEGEGRRGSYVSGPYPGPVAPAAADAATPAAAR